MAEEYEIQTNEQVINIRERQAQKEQQKLLEQILEEILKLRKEIK